jgi:hypothetical protein
MRNTLNGEHVSKLSISRIIREHKIFRSSLSNIGLIKLKKPSRATVPLAHFKAALTPVHYLLNFNDFT